MKNGAKQDIPLGQVQHVKVGAVVQLNKPTLEHGILLHHPELPPFKLFVEIGEKDGQKIIGQYRFELVEKSSPDVNRMVVDVVHPDDPDAGIVMPPQSKLIMPGDN